MEFIIKDLQIIESNKIDISKLKEILRGNSVQLNAKYVNRTFLNGYTNKFEDKLNSFIHYNECLFNTNLELIGVLGVLNKYITSHLKINSYINKSEWYIIEDTLSKKAINLIKKYSNYKVNIVTEYAFTALCNVPIKIDITPNFVKDISDNYLKEQFENIENLDLLDNNSVEDPFLKQLENATNNNRTLISELPSISTNDEVIITTATEQDFFEEVEADVARERLTEHIDEILEDEEGEPAF